MRCGISKVDRKCFVFFNKWKLNNRLQWLVKETENATEVVQKQ